MSELRPTSNNDDGIDYVEVNWYLKTTWVSREIVLHRSGGGY